MKKAIIIVPGILGSQLVTTEKVVIPKKEGIDFENTFQKNTRFWDPLAANLLLVDEKLAMLACDENGKAVYPTTSAPIKNSEEPSKGRIQYGAIDMYHGLYAKLSRSFRKDYEVILYEYDWRKDPYDTARELSDYIDRQGYEEVVFVAHSMGGIVTSHYLAMGNRQRKLVKKHISIGTPYLGAVEMPYIFCTGHIRKSALVNALVSAPVLDLIGNVPSIYALFPYEERFRPYLLLERNGGEQTTLETYEETMQFLKSHMRNWNDTLAEKVFANQKELFLEDGRYITDLVDAYYIVGRSINTTQQIICHIGGEKSAKEQGRYRKRTYCAGDGTVSSYSATLGRSVQKRLLYFKKTLCHEQATHCGMLGDTQDNPIDNTTAKFIASIIDGKAVRYSAEDLSAYGIEQPGRTLRANSPLAQ